MIFFPTMGGAAVGDDDIGLQALRVRAAENHVYVVVAFRGGGSMMISPRGKIIARAEGDDGLAQVTELRVIFDFFGAGIARKSNGDGRGTVATRCSEDLLS